MSKNTHLEHLEDSILLDGEQGAKDAFMFLDEYYSLKFPGAKIATDEFFSKINSKPKLISKHRNEFERWGVIKD